MRKAIAIMIQIIILTAAVFAITNTIEANTYFGSVSYNVDDIAENIRWIMLGAGILSVFNIWFLWPRAKEVKVTNIPTEVSPAEGANTKSAEAEKDPIVPKMD